MNINKLLHDWFWHLFKDGVASNPLIVQPGVIYGDDAASIINPAGTTEPFTISVWVYLFRTDQEAYMFSKVVSLSH